MFWLWLTTERSLSISRPSVVDRFWSHVDKSDECWLWVGTKFGNGYGRFWDGKDRGAHVFSYEMGSGSVPRGLQIDHLCRVRHCVRPSHLEAVTPKENVRRARGSWTACSHGHVYTEATTRINANGSRACRPCKAEWMRSRRKAAKA